MKKVLTSFILVMLLCTAALMAQSAAEQPAAALNYPTKPITIICPWAPGGSSDLTVRTIASMSQKYLGVTMNVVNREGGNGAVALTELAKTTAADGYTISLCSAGNFTTMPFVQDVGYTIDDFKFVIGTTSEPLAVIVRADSPLKGLKDIVDRYKQDGKTVLHGQSGANGANHMHSIEMFRNMGVPEKVVPYSGASTALAALLGGEVEMILIHPRQVISHIKTGAVRLIAMVYNERVPSFAEVATVEEQGYGKVHAETYKSLVVPAKTDPAIVAWLTERFDKMMQDPEYIEFLKNNGLERSYYLGDEVGKVIKAEVTTLWPLMEELKILKKGAVKPVY